MKRILLSGVGLVMLMALTACETKTPISPGIRGWVADATTGKPLAGVRVSANDDTGRKAITKEDGRFMLPPAFRTEWIVPGSFNYHSSPATLKLRLSVEGYEETYVSTESMNAYEPIRMKPLPENLRE